MYIILLLTKFYLFNLIHILLYVCCVPFVVINMTISISCKKIYRKINDMNMNMNIIQFEFVLTTVLIIFLGENAENNLGPSRFYYC